MLSIFKTAVLSIRLVLSFSNIRLNFSLKFDVAMFPLTNLMELPIYLLFTLVSLRGKDIEGKD